MVERMTSRGTLRLTWHGYVVAILLTVGTLLLRLSITSWFGDRPLLILFMIPIIIAAYLGGLGPGLLATGLAGLGTNYYLFPPLQSLFIYRLADAAQWLVFIASGILIALLSGRLHRFRQQAESLAQQSRQVEEQIRAREEHFRQLAESLPQLVWTATTDGTCDYFGPQWLEYTGAKPESQLGLGWLEQVHPDDRQRLLQEWKVTLAVDLDFQTEIRIRRHDGIYHWFDTRAIPLRDATGKIIKWFGSNTDIEEQKRNEQEQTQRQEQFRTVVENAPDAIFVQTHGCFAYVNPQAVHLFGATSPEQLIGRSVLEMFHPDHREGVKARIRKLNEERKMVPQIIEKIIRCDGTEIDVEVSAAPFLYQGTHGALVFFRDISKRLESERDKERLERQLLQSQKMDALGRLSGGIAHDFNNILAAIAGNVKVSLLNLPEHVPIRQNLLEIDQAARRAADLVRRILTFSRQEEPIRRPLELQIVVAEAVRLLRASLPAMIEIRSHLPPSTPRISGDATQIHQIIMNLGTNAAHAMINQRGSIEFTLETVDLTSPQAEAIPDITPGRYARLTVSDTGEGMNKATTERIFEPFFTTKGVGEGTGLGLSVVHGIIKNHQGAITVCSQPGQGSVFHLYFPVTEIMDEKNKSRSTSAPRGNQERILFVDDEKALVMVSKLILEKVGYRVTGFTIPTEALEAFRANPDGFDLVVTDCSMPGMSGFELARQIRQLRPDCPIILSSGYVRKQDLEEAKALNIHHFISKPNTIDEMETVLHEVLSSKKK